MFSSVSFQKCWISSPLKSTRTLYLSAVLINRHLARTSHLQSCLFSFFKQISYYYGCVKILWWPILNNKQSRNISLPKQRIFLPCKYICKNSAINKHCLLISGNSVQGDWKLHGFMCCWLRNILTDTGKPQLCVFTAPCGLKVKPEKSVSAAWDVHSKRPVLLQETALSCTDSSEFMSALVMFILLSLIFPPSSSCLPVSPELHTPLLWGSFFSLGWNEFASGPLPHLSSDLKMLLT